MLVALLSEGFALLFVGVLKWLKEDSISHLDHFGIFGLIKGFYTPMNS